MARSAHVSAELRESDDEGADGSISHRNPHHSGVDSRNGSENRQAAIREGTCRICSLEGR